MQQILQITKNLADILLLFTRDPRYLEFAFELEYYTNHDGGLLGIIVLDITDDTFNTVVLSRDEANQYKAISTNIDFVSIEEARAFLESDMTSDKIIYHDKAKFFDVFQNINKPKQEHPFFKLLNTQSHYLSAKEAIKEVSYHYKDIDGNFIDQFQSINGFDARLWELYLFCFFKEQYFLFNRDHEAPDFLVEKSGQRIAIEAVIVSRKNKDFEPKDPKTKDEMDALLQHEIPLMISNAVYDKTKKKYWEKEHVKHIPFIIALAEFHDSLSMIWTFEAYLTSLYGIRPKIEIDSKGNKKEVQEQVTNFVKANGTEIPAGLFALDEYKNVSAIFHNPLATISKFNRMGRQAGLGKADNILLWNVAYHDHTPGALYPNFVSKIIDETCTENWTMGATLFHNPNALIPIDPTLFDKNVAHYFFDEGKIVSWIPQKHAYNGFVVNQVTKPNTEISAKAKL